MLVDFGISRFLIGTQTLETTTNAGNGSLRWQAPEMLSPAQEEGLFTTKSDIWALGMTYLVSIILHTFRILKRRS